MGTCAWNSLHYFLLMTLLVQLLKWPGIGSKHARESWAHIEVSQGGNSCNIFLNSCENRQIFPNYCKFTQLNCCKLQNIGFSLLSPSSSPPFPLGLDGRARDGGRKGGVLRTMMSPFQFLYLLYMSIPPTQTQRSWTLQIGCGLVCLCHLRTGCTSDHIALTFWH